MCPSQENHIVFIGGKNATSWPRKVVRHLFAGAAATAVNWSGNVGPLAKKSPGGSEGKRVKIGETQLGKVLASK
jgi:hypothetical protein